MPDPGVNSESILRTKIRVPKLHNTLVGRTHLLAHLHEGLARQVSLVCAPAGSGKSTLVVDWLNQSDLTAAWLSLDEDDNNLERFLTYLVASIQKAVPGVGANAQAMLKAPSPVQPEAFTNSLINDLDDTDQDLVLVLDDYHIIHLPAIHDAINYLVEHLPETLHLVIASRADPPLPLGKLRARNQLVEIRGSDLQFNRAEAAEFLNQVMRLQLSQEDVERLEKRTEGWIAGLQLAALALHDKADPDQFIQNFTGSHRFVLDYLVEEVLRQQDPNIQDFLLKTSILERMCDGLCNMLTGRQDSRTILATLEKSNLFIIPLDDEYQWYRYHTLFRDLLRYQLEQAHPAEVDELQRKAAAWFEEKQMIVDAVHHRLAANEIQQAAFLVQQGCQQLLSSGMVNQVLGWFNILPASIFNANPGLHMIYAYSLISAGQFNAVEPHLQAVEHALAGTPAAETFQADIDATRAIIAFTTGNFARAIEMGQKALTGLPKTSDMYSSVLMGMGVAYHIAGDLDNARPVFAEAASAAEQMGQHSVTISSLCNLSQVYLEQGHLHLSKETYQRSIDLAGRVPGGIPMIGMAYSDLSNLYYEWNELPTAMNLVGQSFQWLEQWGNTEIKVASYARQALYELASGDTEAAMQAMSTANELTPGAWDSPIADQMVRIYNLTFLLRSGQLKQAYQIIQNQKFSLEVRLGNLAENQVIVSVLVAIGRAQNNARLLQSALQKAEQLLPVLQQSGQVYLMLQTRLQKVLVLNFLGNPQEALGLLEETLAQTEPEGYVRSYIDCGPQMADLLRQISTGSPQYDYTLHLLEAFHQENAVAEPVNAPLPAEKSVPGGLVEPLSEREIEVLQWVARGLSNQEIAQRLTLSPGTVKRHLHNIFEKLEVSTRAQAIARARQLNLA